VPDADKKCASGSSGQAMDALPGDFYPVERCLSGCIWHSGLHPILHLKGEAMLYYAVVFLIIAIIAGFFGFFGVAGLAAMIAKILFVVFIILFIVSLIFGRKRI
jgi:uncharacterized membrane protein YtjA (UPF0391 family)